MLFCKNVVSMQLRLVSTKVNQPSINKLKDVSQSGINNSSISENRKLRNNEVGVTKDGGQKFVGFTFYPRHPDHQDPPYTPSKVLMIERIRCLKNKPYWDKDIMKSLGLDSRRSEKAIIANTPSNCHLLWKVKHLIRITPITLPQGLPEDGDLSGARLQDNGELRFIPKLKQDMEKVAETANPLEKPANFMDGETLKKYLRLKWIKPW